MPARPRSSRSRSRGAALDDRRAQEAYRRAFEAEPDDPAALAGYLEYQIAHDKNLRGMIAAGPVVAAALATCESRTRAGIDVPGGFFTAGFLHLLLGDAYEALDAYAKAIERSNTAYQVACALDALERIEPVQDALKGYGWAVRLLQLGLDARLPDKASTAAVRALATVGATPLAEPIVMVAGGCDPARAEQFERYRDMLVRGFAEYCGTVIRRRHARGREWAHRRCSGEEPTHACNELPAEAAAARRVARSALLGDSRDRRRRLHADGPTAGVDGHHRRGDRLLPACGCSASMAASSQLPSTASHSRSGPPSPLPKTAAERRRRSSRTSGGVPRNAS